MAKASDVEKHEEEELHSEYAKGGAAHGKHLTHAGHRHASHGHELKDEGPHPGHPKDGPHVRRAHGGKAGKDTMESKHEMVQEYNAKGSNEMSEAGDEKPGFKRGGGMHHRRRHGGMAEGKMATERMDRRPRRAAGGRTAVHNPYSSASNMADPEKDMEGRGYEGKIHKP